MDTLFTKTSVPRAYFTLAMPVVISMIASMIYNLVDTFFISQTQNPNIVAGVTVCTPLFSIMLAIGDVFGLGGSALQISVKCPPSECRQQSPHKNKYDSLDWLIHAACYPTLWLG